MNSSIEDGRRVAFAVVGCGNIGRRHLAILDALDGARLAAFCDTDDAKRAHYSSLYPEAVAFASIDEMLPSAPVDVVAVCTPHYLHTAHALKAIECGRHVLVEKPLALTVADADRMVAAAAAAQVKLMVVKQNRYNVPVALTSAAINEGRLGRILMCQCSVAWNRRADYYTESPWLGRRPLEGGALFTQVSHFIDLMLWFCGDVVDAVGRVETKAHDIEIEDCGTAQLLFERGTMGSLFWTTCAHGRNFEGSILLIGERGIIKIGGQYLNRIEHWDVEAYPLAPDVSWVDQPNSYGKYQGSSSNHDKVFADVVRTIRGGAEETVSGEEGRRTVRAIELIYSRCEGVRCGVD